MLDHESTPGMLTKLSNEDERHSDSAHKFGAAKAKQ